MIIKNKSWLLMSAYMSIMMASEQPEKTIDSTQNYAMRALPIYIRNLEKQKVRQQCLSRNQLFTIGADLPQGRKYIGMSQKGTILTENMLAKL